MRQMQKNTRLIKTSVCGTVALLAVLLDQLTKYLIVKNFELGESVVIIKNVFRFTYITNDGSAFGMLSDARWVFMLFSTLGIMAMMAYVIYFAKDNTWFTTVSFGMVIGGGIGNMIDRLFNGEVFGKGVVIDFIDFYAFPEIWKWVFNVADSFVCVGVALLIVSFIAEEVGRSKAKKTSKAEEEETKEEESKA